MAASDTPAPDDVPPMAVAPPLATHRPDPTPGPAPPARAEDGGTPTSDARSVAAADARPAGDAATTLDGARGDASPPPAPLPGDEPPPGWRQAIVGVGYAGVRTRSLDLGLTWPDLQRLAATGGDDQNLLRCVAWGRGTWITGGWQLFTSTDGVEWTKRAVPQGCGLMQGCAYGNGRFVATCGSNSFLSVDAGVTWRRGGAIDTGGHPNLLFGGGKFALWGDSNRVFTSTDGVTWTVAPGLTSAGYCNDRLQNRPDCGDADWGFGVGLKGWFQSMGGSGIFRTTDLKSWKKISPQGGLERFAFGYVAP